MRQDKRYHGDRSMVDMLKDHRMAIEAQFNELDRQYREIYSLQIVGREVRHTVLTWVAAGMWGYIFSIALAWRLPIVAEHWEKIWR